MITEKIQQAADEILSCYNELQTKQSNLVWELIKDVNEFYEWDHYPLGDAQDHTTGAQYYYHSHPGHDKERFEEHGHFHIYIRKFGIDEKLQPIYISQQNDQNPPDDLCHLFAIAMADNGYPRGFFTVNHWVTHGIWYKAEDMCQILNSFNITCNNSSSIVNRWINSILQLYKSEIQQLLLKRDEVIDDWQNKNKSICALHDKNLEVTSIFSL